MKTRYLRLVKKQRGFTLIELLAVILILGIIALIAIPTVTSVVEQSRKGAAESSASQFVTSVGELIMTEELVGNVIADGLYTAEELQNKGLNIKGTMPDSGFIQIEGGEVVGCNLTYGGFNVTCDGSDFVSKKEEDKTSFVLKEDNDSNNELSVGDKVCLDTECFYVIRFDGDNVRMLSEWNLNVGYEAMRDNDYYFASHGYQREYQPNLKSYTYSDLKYYKISVPSYQIRQDYLRKGEFYDTQKKVYSMRGVINFVDLESIDSSKRYWTDDSNKLLPEFGDKSPAYVYNKNSKLYPFVDAYLKNLIVLSGNNNINGEIPSEYDLQELGCDIDEGECIDVPSWIYHVSYWTGTCYGNLIGVDNYGNLFGNYGFTITAGVRPVITIPKTSIKN